MPTPDGALTVGEVGSPEDAVFADLDGDGLIAGPQRPGHGAGRIDVDVGDDDGGALLAQPAGAVGGSESAADQQVVDLAASHP